MSILFPPVIDQIFYDKDGSSPLGGGFVRAFYHGVATLAPTYNHSDNPNSNPITLSSSGRCQFKLSTDISYDIKTYDSNNSLVETFENIRLVASGGAGVGAFDLVGQGLEIVGTEPNRTLQLTNGIIADINSRVLRSGDTMTGDLTVNKTGQASSVKISNIFGAGRIKIESPDDSHNIIEYANDDDARVEAGGNVHYSAMYASDNGSGDAYVLSANTDTGHRSVMDTEGVRVETNDHYSEQSATDLVFDGVSIFDYINGKLDSVVAGTNISVDNTDPQNPVVSIPEIDVLSFDTTPETLVDSDVAGQQGWNETDKTLNLTHGNGVVQQIGQELPIPAKNDSDSNFIDGEIGHIIGASGQRISMGKPSASDISALKALFMATQTISDNNTGFFNALGIVRGLNTLAFVEGQEVWLGENGAIESEAPQKPAYQARMGYVVNVHGIQGSIFFHPDIYPKQGDLSDTDTTDSVRGDFLTKGDNGVFKPNIFWDDWRWAGSGVNPIGSATPSVLTEVETDEWHWVFTNNATMSFPDQQIPHTYKEGTDIYPHIHFASTSNGTYTGTWTAIFTLWSGGYGGSLKTKYTRTASFNKTMVAGIEEVLNFDSVISGLGRTISSCGTITLKLSLTSGSGLFVLGFDGHYEKDRFGSNEITSK